MLSPNFERSLFKLGYKRVIGIDEVGRGCWAGPLVIAAAQLDLKHFDDSQHIDYVRDSKKLSRKRRQEIVALAGKTKIDVAYATASARLISEQGLKAGLMHAVTDLIRQMDIDDQTYLLLDGALKLPSQLDSESAEIVKGDDRVYSIALASIHAKETRDYYMRQLDPKYPEYGFARNVGYGTKEHREAIEAYGVTPEHRLSFKPLKKYANRP